MKEGGTMTDYERTVQALKDLDSKVSKKEWNKIAMEHGFLSSYSIARLSGMSYTQFCTNLRKRN